MASNLGVWGKSENWIRFDGKERWRRICQNVSRQLEADVCERDVKSDSVSI